MYVWIYLWVYKTNRITEFCYYTNYIENPCSLKLLYTNNRPYAIKNVSLSDLFAMFPDDEAARKWFESNLWPDGPVCPHCSSVEYHSTTHPRIPYRCGTCRKFYSVRMGTIMEKTHITYRDWAIATYLYQTRPKGVSSVQLAKDLGITQKSTWFLAHRLRVSWRTLAGGERFSGPSK